MRVTVSTVHDASGNITETHIQICKNLPFQPDQRPEVTAGTMAVLPSSLHDLPGLVRDKAEPARQNISGRLSLLAALALPLTRLLLDFGPAVFTGF